MWGAQAHDSVPRSQCRHLGEEVKVIKLHIHSCRSSRYYLTKAEVALVLLSEIAMEQDEEFRPHLHVLLHIATLNAGELVPELDSPALWPALASKACNHSCPAVSTRADSSSSVVRREAAHLIIFLLNSLALKHLGSAADKQSQEYSLLSSFIESLQRKQGSALWPRERPTLACPFIPSAASVASFVNQGELCEQGGPFVGSGQVHRPARQIDM